MHKLLSHWLEFSLDLIFPPTCFYCDVDLVGRESICQSCVDSLARIDAPYCEVCGEPFDGLINSKVVCPNCTDIDLKFDFAIAPLRFSERSVRFKCEDVDVKVELFDPDPPLLKGRGDVTFSFKNMDLFGNFSHCYS